MSYWQLPLGPVKPLGVLLLEEGKKEQWDVTFHSYRKVLFLLLVA